MKAESESASGARVRDWLRDIGCTPILRSNPELNWAYEVDFPPKSPTRVTVQNQKNLPRAVLIVSRTLVSPVQIAAFENLEEDARQEFWRALGLRLNSHDFVEFNIEGVPPNTCPTAFQIVVTRWDDGLTLDSFARSLSSVNKAYFDACAFFHEHFGTSGPAAGGEFDFKRLTVQ
jgi:hypothetical protein